MTKEQLITELSTRRISKSEVDRLASSIVNDPSLVPTVLKRVFEEDGTDYFNAAWVFDNAMRRNLRLLLPHVDMFISGLPSLRSESTIRPMAHVCELLTVAYFKKKDALFKKSLSDKDLEQLVTVCFDWLIGKHKVAAKVFAMTSLFYLGEKFDWVHAELKLVLEQTMANGTTGYKNRAQKTLHKLRALEN